MATQVMDIKQLTEQAGLEPRNIRKYLKHLVEDQLIRSFKVTGHRITIETFPDQEPQDEDHYGFAAGCRKVTNK